MSDWVIVRLDSPISLVSIFDNVIFKEAKATM